MSFYTPFSSTWVHPGVIAAVVATGGFLVLLGWAVARFRRPPPCDEQEYSPAQRALPKR